MMNKVTGSCVVSPGTHVTQIVTGVSFLIGETGCRRDSAMVCGREILGEQMVLGEQTPVTKTDSQKRINLSS